MMIAKCSTISTQSISVACENTNQNNVISAGQNKLKIKDNQTYTDFTLISRLKITRVRPTTFFP